MPDAMPDFEKLGVFYLGRLYDWAARKRRESLLLYDSRDLVTHAICIGMTGSGKTGLCLSLLEEALLDGIPALLIDPKGDLANLLLTFPELRPEDFRPWVNEDDARRQGLSVEAYAVQQTELWKRGLAEWGQSGDRIRRLREAADFAVYTPGSTTGLPVSILESIAAPPAGVLAESDLLRERINTAASSLLGLLGIEADPLKSREHILVAKLFESAWKDGHDVDLAGLIAAIQTPPFARIGALDLEAFYPARDRFALATALNNLLAAPGFDVWLSGEPLDIDALLHTPSGKPRASIFSIAHLSDAERMFFVSLLLNETLGWMRSQSGTGSLRAIVYMDEIFGYFPPVANPPSKTPLLTLLKQARAFGVGVVLATQNPVDLDYKGLANTGTWFVGRLQTERDKARVLEGLEGATAGSGRRFDRQRLGEILAGLGNRVFVLNNVHEDQPEVFETRWAMSYLRGPLSRDQIRRLMEARRAPAAPEAADRAAAHTAPEPASSHPPAPAAGSARPVLPPGVPQHFLPARIAAPPGSVLLYEPMLFGAAAVRFADTKAGVDLVQELAFLTPVTAEPVPVRWEDGTEVPLGPGALEPEPREPARFAELPAPAAKAKNYEVWRREFVAWLSRSRTLELLRHPESRLVSRPGDSERDFRIRLGEAARQQRDAGKGQLERRYAPRIAALEERLRRAQQAVEREKEQVTHAGIQAAISVGATLLGALLGRRAVSATALGRATTAARGTGRVLKERQDIGRAQETAEALQQQIVALEAAFQSEVAALESRIDPLTARLEPVAVKAKKADVTVRLVSLGWVPQWQGADGRSTPAWR